VHELLLMHVMSFSRRLYIPLLTVAAASAVVDIYMQVETFNSNFDTVHDAFIGKDLVEMYIAVVIFQHRSHH